MRLPGTSTSWASAKLDSNRTEIAPRISPSGALTFFLWRNPVERLRTRLSVSAERLLNFVQLSDALTVYGRDPDAVLDAVCDVYGTALVWGVPIRGGLAHGELFHVEYPERPGTAITLFGAGLIDAYETERAAKGCGMRLFLAPSFLAQLGESSLVRRHCCGNAEYAWWHRCGLDSEEFRKKVERFWTEKNVRLWFKGPNRTDTERVFSIAIEDLSQEGVGG